MGEVPVVATAAEARKRALAAREDSKNHPETNNLKAENPVTTALINIQKTIEARNYAAAAAELKKLLAENPSDSRIYYNIGRVAALSAVAIEDPDAQAEKLIEAKAAYNSVISNATPDTDKALLSLTYVALARIYEHFNKTDDAIKLYDAAIKLTDVAGGGFNEALAGKQRLLKPQ